MAALTGAASTKQEELRRGAMASEEVLASLVRPIHSGRVAAWWMAGGLAGYGAAPLLEAPAWGWPALVAGAVGAGGQVFRGIRVRERQVMTMSIIGGLSPLLGVRELTPQTVVARRWTFGRDSVPARIDFRYHPGIDATGVWRAEVLRVVAARTGRNYVASVNPRRRRVKLRLDTAAPKVASELSPDRVRLDTNVAKLLGATAKTDKVVVNDAGQIVSFEITHNEAARLAARGYRRRVEAVIGTILPGRWRARWDLERDMVVFEVRPTLPKVVWMPVPRPQDAKAMLTSFREVEIPYGVDEDGRRVGWRPGVMPHFMITGQTGMGKTSTSRAIIAGITSIGWPMWIADVKRVEFRDVRDWPNVQAVATTIPQIVAMIHQARRVMMERYELVSNGRARTSDFEPLVILIDEYTEFVNALRAWYAAVKVRGEPMQPPAMDDVASILRLGRTGRVHLVVTAQRPDVTLFGTGEMRDNMGQRASMGRLSPKGAEMMWESTNVGVSLPRGAVGRMTTTNDDGDPVEAQAYRFPDIDAPAGSDEAALLAALRPAHSSHERLLILPPESAEDDKRLTWHDYANVPWARAVDRPDLDPLVVADDNEFDAAVAGSTIGVLGLADAAQAPRPRPQPVGPGTLLPNDGDDSCAPTDSASGDGADNGELLELLIEAAELVITTQYASTAMLQRKMRIGFAKAGVLLTALQDADIVGAKGSDNNHDVLIDPVDLKDTLSRLRGDDPPPQPTAPPAVGTPPAPPAPAPQAERYATVTELRRTDRPDPIDSIDPAAPGDIDGYGPEKTGYAPRLNIGDLVCLDDGQDRWVVVDQDPEEDFAAPGSWAISWRDDTDDFGVLSWPEDDPLTIREPLDDTGEWE